MAVIMLGYALLLPFYQRLRMTSTGEGQQAAPAREE